MSHIIEFRLAITQQSWNGAIIDTTIGRVGVNCSKLFVTTPHTVSCNIMSLSACWPYISVHYLSDVLQFPILRKCRRLKWDENGKNWIRVMPRIRHFTVYNTYDADILQRTM